MAEDICDTCGKPIIPNVDPRYTAAEPGPRHWDCHQRVHLGGHNSSKEHFDDLMADFALKHERAMEAIAKLRKML